MTKARDLSKGVFAGIEASSLDVESTGPTTISIEDTDNGFSATTLTVQNGGRDVALTVPQDTIFTQGSTESMRIFNNGDIKATSEGGTANKIDLRQGSAKFWVNYYHVSGTPTAQDSFNVSSLSDRGTGRVAIVINNNMNNANFAGGGMAGHDSGTGSSGKTAQIERQTGFPFTTGSVAVQTVYDPSPSLSDVVDDERAIFVFHGDLA